MRVIKGLTIIFIFLFLSSSQILAQYHGWTMKCVVPYMRAGATSTVYEGKIFLMGGIISETENLDRNETYDPAANLWGPLLAPIPTPRGKLTSEIVNGIIYVIGGGLPNGTNKNEAYNPVDNTWISKADMPDQIQGMKAAMVDGIIYTVGGYDHNSCFAYNPATDTWIPKTSIPSPGGYLSVIAYNGLIYAFGGSTDNPWTPSSSVFAYNPQTDTWIQKQSMPTARFGLHSYLVNGKIYVMGGAQVENATLRSVEIYDPVNDSWQLIADMPVSVMFHTGQVVNNKIYVISGTTNWINGLQQVWEFDPSVVDIKDEESIPASFTLYQNHPNPFNPTTTIKYSIPSASNVRLKIFDILGNEIETLLDEEKPSGNYSIVWNAANYSNGIYFYKLQAGSFIETKKMILLK